MDDYEYQENFFNTHWANDLLDKPAALICVIETKIVRAALAERRKIIAAIEDRWDKHCEGERDVGECSVCFLYNDIISAINFIDHP